MRLSVFCGVSVDGFLARSDDTLDFLDAGGQTPHGFAEFFAGIDAVVWGRRTFEVVSKLGGVSFFKNKRVFVLSSHALDLTSAEGSHVEQACGDPAEIKKQLEARGFQQIYVDGGITIQRFLAAGCIDRMIVTRVPVLIGAGIPLFGPLPQDIRLRHVDTRTYAGGLVQSEYEIDSSASASQQVSESAS